MIVTFGLLIFAPMEAFEQKQRIDKTRVTIARQADQLTNKVRAVSKEEAEFQRRLKHTPTKYRENLLAKRAQGTAQQPTIGPGIGGGRQRTYDPPGQVSVINE